MLYSEIIGVCSQIHTKYINIPCGQNVELLNVKLVVHIMTTGLYRVNSSQTVQQHTIWKQAVNNGIAKNVEEVAMA